MVKIKICGVQNIQTIDHLNKVKPDFVGFVFAKSHRQISLNQALLLRKKLDFRIPTVGVFVDAPFEIMQKSITSGAVSYIQLHGHESEQIVLRLQQIGAKVIKVVSDLTNLTSRADYLMLDSGSGSGIPLDWQTLPYIEKPWVLAGGLTNANLKNAFMLTKAKILDVSSGVETNGTKDLNKITEIIKTAHLLR